MRPGPWGACVGASVHRCCAVRRELPKSYQVSCMRALVWGVSASELSAGQVWSRSTRT